MGVNSITQGPLLSDIPPLWPYPFYKVNYDIVKTSWTYSTVPPVVEEQRNLRAVLLGAPGRNFPVFQNVYIDIDVYIYIDVYIDIKTRPKAKAVRNKEKSEKKEEQSGERRIDKNDNYSN